MLRGNMACCVKLGGEDLSRYSNKIESVCLRKYAYYQPRAGFGAVSKWVICAYDALVDFGAV